MPAMRSIILCACLLLAGCVAMQAQPAPALVGEAFYLSGRVAVKYQGRAQSGGLTWQHGLAGDELLLSNPLGQGIARIARSGASVTLTTSDEKIYRANDVETLTEQVLGWRFPFAGLADWVRGRAAAGAPAQTRLDSSQRLAELSQSGWQVEYLEYNGESGPPARLRLSRASVEIRLVIDEWRSAP